MTVVRRRILLPFYLGLLLSACASGPENTPETSTTDSTSTLEEIVEARGYVETTKSLGNEWRVSHPLTGNKTMGLGDMLVLAENAENRGDLDQAREIALLVSKYSRLSIFQSRNNLDAKPRYPQN